MFTIGHSTRTIDEFVAMLQSFNVALVADIRHFPGSRKYPHFNKEALQQSLAQNNIQYVHLENLGGRRKLHKDSVNTAWHHPAFRAYADYMQTNNFKEGINTLRDLAQQQPVAFMCSEAVWWRCHRSMVADYLKAGGWTVMHIMAVSKAEEHPYTAPAKVIGGQLTYQPEQL